MSTLAVPPLPEWYRDAVCLGHLGFTELPHDVRRG